MLDHIHVWTGGVDSTAFVEEIFDCLVTGKNHEDSGAEHQTVDGTVFAGPLLKLKVCIYSGHLVNVAKDGYGGRARRVVLIATTYGQHLQDKKNDGKDSKDGRGCQGHVG